MSTLKQKLKKIPSPIREMIVVNIKCDDPYRYYKDKIGGLYRIIDAKEDYIKRLEDKIASLESTLRKLS